MLCYRVHMAGKSKLPTIMLHQVSIRYSSLEHYTRPRYKGWYKSPVKQKEGACLRKIFLILLLSLIGVPGVLAQDSAPMPVEPTAVEAVAADAKILSGDFYVTSPSNPTVLLLHELYTTRSSWNNLTTVLLQAGYNVLAVDLRGYGQTQGDINWTKAVSDVQAWMNWLKLESGVDASRVSIIGSSMGANLALVGCGNDAACSTVIAISPGWRYYGIGVQDALENGLASRTVLLIYSARDRWPALGIPKMLDVAAGELTLLEYPGNVHGMGLFATEGETLVPAILEWLGANGR